MSGAAAKVRTWLGAGDTVALPDGFHALVPASEPISVGAVPVRPTLVMAAASGMAVRSRMSVSGHRVSFPADTGSRVSITLRWSGLSEAELQTVRTFFEDQCGSGVRGFDVDLDDSGVASTLVATGTLSMRQVTGGLSPVHEAELAAVQVIS